MKRSLVVCSFSGGGGGGGGGGESGAEEAGDESGVEKADDGVDEPFEACALRVFIVLLETRLAPRAPPSPSSSPLPLPSARPPPPEELETGLALLQSSSLRRRKSSRLTGLTPSTNSSCRSRSVSTMRSQGVSEPPSEAVVDRIVSSENELGGKEDRMRDSVWVGSVDPGGGGGVGEGDEGREAEARGIWKDVASGGQRSRIEQEGDVCSNMTYLCDMRWPVVRTVDVAHAAPVLPVVVGEVAR